MAESEYNSQQSHPALQTLGSLALGLLVGGVIRRRLHQRETKRPQPPSTERALSRIEIETLLHGAAKAREPLDLTGANLQGADLKELDLSGANLCGANISRANVRSTSLAGADLRDVDATGTNFVDTKLAGARIYGMKLDNAYLPAYTLRPGRGKSRILGDWEYAKASGEFRDYHYARVTALSLKNHLQAIGRYGESLWAYQLEQRILRALVNPRRRIRWARQAKKKITLRSIAQFTLRWVVSLLADITCGYGESVGRILATLIIMQLVFTLGYWWSGSVVNASGMPVTDLYSVVVFSLGAMTTTGVRGLHPASSAVELAMSLQVILGIAITGLLGFVLGNRIRYSA